MNDDESTTTATPVWVQAGVTEADWRAMSAHLRAEALRHTRARTNGHEDHLVTALTVELDAFLGCPDPDYDWIIERLLEGRDRVLVTGNEGGGKSTLLRQMGVQFAAGIHPFTGEDIDPMRVLYLDAENSERQVRRALRPLRAAAGDRYTHERFQLRILTGRVDLLRPEHADAIVKIAVDAEPDIIIIGPLYKLADGDPTIEVTGKAVATALDNLRHSTDAALLIEAHTPYGESAKARPLRPYGWSGWSRWPEFGLNLGDDGRIRHWRGPRDERDWPTKLERGGDPWPWAVGEAAPVDYEGPTNCLDAIIAELRLDPELGVNALESRLRAKGKGFRKQTVGQAAELGVNRQLLARRSGPRKAILYRLTDGPEQATMDEDF